jgi:hypothetical protein
MATMADFQQRDMTGVLFRNERKTADNHPSHTGTITIGGVEYRIAAWVKEGAKGRFFSLKVTPPDGAQQEAPLTGPRRTRQPGDYPTPQASRGGPRRPISDDPIPF